MNTVQVEFWARGLYSLTQSPKRARKNPLITFLHIKP